MHQPNQPTSEQASNPNQQRSSGLAIIPHLLPGEPGPSWCLLISEITHLADLQFCFYLLSVLKIAFIMVMSCICTMSAQRIIMIKRWCISSVLCQQAAQRDVQQQQYLARYHNIACEKGASWVGADYLLTFLAVPPSPP